MHSSTSSSEAAGAARAAVDYRPYRRGIVVALAGAALLWAGFEVSSYFGFRRISGMERRRLADHAAARALRPAAPGAAPTVLVMGNSLLLDGLDYDGIRQQARPYAAVTRLAVENTSYYEWYFGMRRLLAEGSRPDVMIVCLSPSQLINNSLGSDYAAHHLLRAEDVYAASRAAHYDLTNASGLAFAQYSFFYARRNTIRTVILSAIAPAYWAMARKMTSQTARFPASSEIERIAEERLRGLRETAEGAGIRFVLLIPPGFSEGEPEITKAGEKTGTRVMVPIHTGALARSYFSDGFHLNPEGARIFTGALAKELEALANSGNRAEGRSTASRGNTE